MAFASIRARELVRVLSAGGRQRLDGVDDVRGLVRLAPARLGREVRAVGLGEKPIGGDARGALAQIGRLRVGDVAGERDVVAAFERGVEQRRRREAMQDDGAGESGERVESRPVGRPGVDDDGLAELGRQRELGLEETQLRVARRVVAVVVEPGLADRDGAVVGEQLTELVEPLRVGVSRVVRVDAEGGVDTVLGARRARARRGTSRSSVPTVIDALDAGGPGPLEHHRGRIGAGVEMRVGVNHRRGQRRPSARARPRPPSPGRAS